jgi:elongation factor P
MQVSTAEFKKGLKIQFDGAPYTIVDFQHVKPGKGGVRPYQLKHMKLGRVIDNTFRAGEKVELVDFEEKRMQYLYKDDRYHFMDLDTYDQISLSAEEVGDARDFLKENTEVEILFIDASPVTVELPNFIELQIVTTDRHPG